jgi:dihydroneopterin aldolase
MKIEICSLEFEAILGILEHERKNRQKVIVNCEIYYDYKENFIDYSKVSQMIETLMISKKFLLIEDALAFLSKKLKKSYKDIKKLKLTIKKPTIMKNSIVSVSETYKY